MIVDDAKTAIYREAEHVDAFFVDPPYDEWLADQSQRDSVAAATAVAAEISELLKAIETSQVKILKNESFAVYLLVPSLYLAHVRDVARLTFTKVEHMLWARSPTKLGKPQFW